MKNHLIELDNILKTIRWIGKKTEIIYLISNPTAIDRLMINIRFKGSKSLKAKKIVIKNIGRVNEKASLLVKNSLKRKKIIRNISKFRDKITDQWKGGTRKIINIIINNKIIIWKISFFGKTSLASLISFYYNWKLWLKWKKTKK